MTRPERILLGVITSAHGVRGEVLVKSFTAEPESLADYGPLTDADGGAPLTLCVRGAVSRGLIAKIDGVGDRDGAEALKGRELWLDRDHLPPEDDGEFYYVDLIGLKAVDLEGAAFGRVADVVNFGAGDLLDIDVTETGKREFIPFNEAHVPEVDLSAGYLTVRWPLQFEVVNPGADGGAGAAAAEDEGGRPGDGLAADDAGE